MASNKSEYCVSKMIPNNKRIKIYILNNKDFNVYHCYYILLFLK